MGHGARCESCGHPSFYHGATGDEPCTGPKQDANGNPVWGVRHIQRCGCPGMVGAPAARAAIGVTLPIKPGCLVITHGVHPDLVAQMRESMVQACGHEQFLIVVLDVDADANVITLADAIALLERETQRVDVQAATVRTCRDCGCTDLDCSGCVKRTGMPCSWVDLDLCSACA